MDNNRTLDNTDKGTICNNRCWEVIQPEYPVIKPVSIYIRDNIGNILRYNQFIDRSILCFNNVRDCIMS